MSVSRMDTLRNEFSRGKAHGDKAREARLRWFGRDRRREITIISIEG